MSRILRSRRLTLDDEYTKAELIFHGCVSGCDTLPVGSSAVAERSKGLNLLGQVLWKP